MNNSKLEREIQKGIEAARELGVKCGDVQNISVRSTHGVFDITKEDMEKLQDGQVVSISVGYMCSLEEL